MINDHNGDDQNQEENAIEIKQDGTINPEKSAPPCDDETKVEDNELFDFIDKAPPEIKKGLRSFVGMFSSIGPAPHPIFSKFNDKHIDKYLDLIRSDDDHEFELKKSNRWFYFGYTIIAIITFGAGVVFLSGRNDDLLLRLIEILVILAGGLGGGYGIAKRKE